MDVMIELNAVPSVKDVEKLRKLYDTIEIVIFSTFDVNSEHYGPILISIIMSKLPEQLRLDISIQMPPENET